MKNLLLKIFILIFSLIVGNFSAFAAADKETLKMLDLFGDVLERVKKDYVEDINEKELIESAINGMLTSLDPHSGYLNEKDFQEMRIQTKGEFGGLGIEVTMENGLVKVVSPIDDTPAYRAGMKAGDFISRIDDESVVGLSLSEAVDKMRGKPGTKINLTVLREAEIEPLQISIVRDIIKIQSVKIKQIDDIVYLRITSFSENTADNAAAEFKKIYKQIGESNFKGVVLDLRNNPGGLLNQAIEVADLFLDKGEIVSTGGKVADSNSRANATKGDIIKNKPIVILINGGSASASEIVAGALQDHKRAVLLGTKSFGKGSVQTVIPLNKSNGAMRLTTSLYYTPSGRSIQAEGIEPDIIVEQSKLEDVTKTPVLSSEANLRKHLVVEENKKITDKKIREQLKLYKEDYQLARAVDLLYALNVYAGR